MLEISLHAPSKTNQFEVHAPQVSFHAPKQTTGYLQVNGMKVHFQDTSTTRILQDCNQRLDSEKGGDSFFNEVDTVKELSSRPLFHFLTSLTQEKELRSHPLFHFLMRLT